MRLLRFMREAGWKPAHGVEERSAHLYRSGGGNAVLTGFWLKG